MEDSPAERSRQVSNILFALAFSLCCIGHAAAQTAGAEPEKINAVLCNTEDQAISLAESMAAGKVEPMALNLVNKQAGSEVCGRFAGYGVVEIRKTKSRGGALFMLAGVHFADDGAFAWTASFVVPFDGAELSRGT
jgi:hypothetical protein